MPLLLNTIELVHDRFNSRLILLGLLVTMYDAASRAAAQVANQIAKYFYKERFQSVIPRDFRLAQASSYGLTILEYDENSPGALAYKAIAEEVIERAQVMVRITISSE